MKKMMAPIPQVLMNAVTGKCSFASKDGNATLQELGS